MTAEKKERCPWAGDDPLYVCYHDNEWGRPVTDDRSLFEYLTLECAQAGLAWITILRKREGYRRAFHGFDHMAVAAMTEDDERRLLLDSSIVRNRLKIHAAIVNARLFGRIVEEFGSFDAYVRTFLPDGRRIVNDVPTIEDIPVTTPVSDAMSRDMRRRGFKFCGSTVCQSFLEAAGYIDDHLNSCPCKS